MSTGRGPDGRKLRDAKPVVKRTVAKKTTKKPTKELGKKIARKSAKRERGPPALPITR